MLHLITYDLNKPTKDYNSLYDAIKKLGSWCHPLNNIWFVNSSQSTNSIRDSLKTVIDNNDELFVLEVKTPTAASWYNLNNDVSQWLKNNL